MTTTTTTEALTITHDGGTQWKVSGPAAVASHLQSVLVRTCALYGDLDHCAALAEEWMGREFTLRVTPSDETPASDGTVGYTVECPDGQPVMGPAMATLLALLDETSEVTESTVTDPEH